MLRITRMDCEDGSTRLKLEGRLVEDWVDVLEETCACALCDPPSLLLLDMAGVRFVDPAGRELLSQLERGGVHMSRRSPYLQALWHT
jgi:hypothetical protein